MINVIDNYLEEGLFKQLQEYCTVSNFEIIKAGDKEFSALGTPQDLLQFLHIEGMEIIFSFIRNAYNGFDNDLRVHADNIIMGEKVDYAGVLYINNEMGVTKNGTAFYKHKEHGFKLSKDCSNEEFDRLLNEDANDESKWEMSDYVSSRPNRFLMYDANYFHSKFPREIEEGVRIVLVVFYKVLSDSQ